MPFPTTLPTILIFLGIFILAFFPHLLFSILYLPLHLLPHLSKASPSAVPTAAPPVMSWSQRTFTLPSRARGSYLITDTVEQNLPELREYKVGLLNLFVQHTSCALALNENWDEDVRADMSDALDRIAPEDRKGTLYRHSAEGLDDMPVSRGVYDWWRTRQGADDCDVTGSYQVGPHRSVRHGPCHEWALGDGNLAGHMAVGVSDLEAFEKGGGHYPGPEELAMATGRLRSLWRLATTIEMDTKPEIHVTHTFRTGVVSRGRRFLVCLANRTALLP